MELELKKVCFDAFEVGAESVVTQEETAETIVPDYCPDIARIIDTEGKIFLHARELRDGKAVVAGTVQINVLYTPDGEGGIRTLNFAMPFTAESEGKAMSECLNLWAVTETEFLETRILNPRKVYTHCKLVTRMTGYQKAPLCVCSDAEGDPALFLQKKLEMQHTSIVTQIVEKEFTFSDELSLSPGKEGAAELLSSRVSGSVTETKIVGNKLILKGLFQVGLFYQTAAGQCGSYHGELPFSQIMERGKGRDHMTNTSIYQNIATRTAGDIYLGVVGPVRTGKSTFIKRFMETQVIPNIDNVYRKERARDELPQSGSGRTIMTAEPKFVPEEAVQVQLPDGASFSVRLVDCVGYMVKSAMGQTENDAPRMVTTPWFDHEIPMAEAAEIGTRKVIAEHSTIGIVVTTDGTIADIPREDYLEAEDRVIRELQALGKPFVVLVNSTDPSAERAQAISKDIASRYQVNCMAVNCLDMGEEEVRQILKAVLYEFPMQEMDLFLPAWVDALPADHPIRSGLYAAIRDGTAALHHIREVDAAVGAMGKCETIRAAKITGIDLGTGIASVELRLPRQLFYKTLSEQSGFAIADDGDLMSLLTSLASVKGEYDKVAGALKDVRETGYGIVVPGMDELKLEEPEIVRQGGRYGVRLRASAPSIHMIRADIETAVSPIVGNEKQSEDMVNYLLQEFEGDTSKIWQSNIFGRSFHELVNEDLQNKLHRMPEDARRKLQEALTRIINEGSGGLICIIL